MSALTKPFINFTNAIDSNIIVPVEQVQSIEKIDVDAMSNPSTPAKIGILFTMVPPYTQPIEVLFADSADRDDAFDAFIAATSTAV